MKSFMRANRRKFNGARKVFIFFILFFTIQAGTTRAASNFFNGLKKTGEVGAGYPAAAAENPGNFLAKMFGMALTPMFMGVVGMLIFAYGGYTYMMARGNEEQAEKAKTILANTAIAMIIAFSAYAIFKLIIPLWIFVTK